MPSWKWKYASANTIITQVVCFSYQRHYLYSYFMPFNKKYLTSSFLNIRDHYGCYVLTLSPLQTALGQSKTMNGRVHWSYSVLCFKYTNTPIKLDWFCPSETFLISNYLNNGLTLRHSSNRNHFSSRVQCWWNSIFFNIKIVNWFNLHPWLIKCVSIYSVLIFSHLFI